jgi:hypothetical protein
MYTVMMRDGSKIKKYYSETLLEIICRNSRKKDSTEVIIPKSNVAAVRDSRKARIATGAPLSEQQELLLW